MKKFIFAIIFLLLTFQITAKPVDNIKQFTLENGMEVFLLEDSSDALVHIEYTCRAGFSSQSQDNAGFFKLFTRLIKSSNKNLPIKRAECNADSSRYFLDVAAAETEDILYKLSDAVFAPQFSEDIFDYEFRKLKNEVATASEDMSVYINSAIDSKVFSDTPWKHDSGIYPPLFKQTSTKTARNHIRNIADNWYTPQNSAIFICGNINVENILVMLQNTFGRFYSTNKTPSSKSLSAINKKRKFVLHAPDISPDLTQVVIQYTMMNMEQNDIIAAALNNNSSIFKQKLLSLESLNIPGDEYINVSAAHQKDNSRLIIQTLLQKPENKEIKTNSLKQALTFYDEAVLSAKNLNDMEFLFGKGLVLSGFSEVISTPISAMEFLSSFWAVSPYYEPSEDDLGNYPDSPTTSLMMSRINKITKTERKPTLEALGAESPYLFVIINSKDYNANKKAYKNAGFEEISTKEANWYVQDLYKEIKNQYNFEDINPYAVTDVNKQDNQYFEKNVNQIKEYTLKNGIKVATKENKEAPGLSILLSIKGGKINSAADNGFEEVMTNILASVIEREIYKKQVQGLIVSNVSVSTDIGLNTSSILINLQNIDAIQVCDAIKIGLIYGEVPPAFADKEVGSKQYRKRLENGSALNQMYSAVINQLYGNSDLANVFESKEDVLEKTNYVSILAAYPALLDGSRYSVIVSGNFPNNIVDLLNSSLGLLGINNVNINKADDKISFPSNKTVKTPIVHTFLTDIPAEEAGPQPAVLIPTTEFLDPVMYVMEAPEFGTKESALFTALLKYLEIPLQKAIDNNSRLENTTVMTRLPENVTNFGTLIFVNVKHTKEIDSIYKSVIQKLIKDLSSPTTGKSIVQEIKNYWSLEEMKDTTTTAGTAALMAKGFEQFPENPAPSFYLEQYNTIQSATVSDFAKILEMFPTIPDLRVYSTDSRK